MELGTSSIPLRVAAYRAAWLNLIEPWWRIPINWALKGSRSQMKEEPGQAVLNATALWNQHPKPYRWKKKYYQNF